MTMKKTLAVLFLSLSLAAVATPAASAAPSGGVKLGNCAAC